MSTPTAGPAASIRRLLERTPVSRPGEVCDMCGETIPDEHSHVVQMDNRNLMCTCRGCYLLFTSPGAARGKYRAVPERYLRDESLVLSAADWESLEIPVRMAFFFRNSELGRTVAFYPSPGGATESELSLEAWRTGLGASRLAAELADDVEALLVRRLSDGGFECFLAPIDVCYELVGIVRLHWRGFDGGDEVWAEVDAFFGRVQERSRCLT